MTWDILPDRQQDYFEFVIRDFVPRMQKMGLQPSDAWYTYYGDYPQILASFVTTSLDDVEKALDSDDWYELNQQLMDFVDDFSYKIVEARGGFQL
jgi:hypothetical protein